jgi:hypothetical protein
MEWRILLGFCSCGRGSRGREGVQGEKRRRRLGGGGCGDECDYGVHGRLGWASESSKDCRMLWAFGPFQFVGL